MEKFIRSKPSLEAEYNLRELLRRRVYEQEAEGSWGHQEFNGVRVHMYVYVCAARVVFTLMPSMSSHIYKVIKLFTLNPSPKARSSHLTVA